MVCSSEEVLRRCGLASLGHYLTGNLDAVHWSLACAFSTERQLARSHCIVLARLLLHQRVSLGLDQAMVLGLVLSRKALCGPTMRFQELTCGTGTAFLVLLLCTMCGTAMRLQELTCGTEMALLFLLRYAMCGTEMGHQVFVGDCDDNARRAAGAILEQCMPTPCQFLSAQVVPAD